jgi:hypothetical protein
VRLVAVDGSGGAGKSVFARRLARRLGGVPVVHTDDFASWENPHLVDSVRGGRPGPLERGDPVRYRAYDWANRQFGDWQEISRGDVVIAEGFSSSRRATVDRLTMAIWIDTPRDERIARGIALDGETMGPAWGRWIVRVSLLSQPRRLWRYARVDRSTSRLVRHGAAMARSTREVPPAATCRRASGSGLPVWSRQGGCEPSRPVSATYQARWLCPRSC